MHTLPNLAGQVQAVLETWVLRGDPMPNQFIYGTADLFASIGYRFRVVQWTTREQAFDQLVSDSNIPGSGSLESPWYVVSSGSRI
jgi:hypothetical protein